MARNLELCREEPIVGPKFRHYSTDIFTLHYSSDIFTLHYATDIFTLHYATDIFTLPRQYFYTAILSDGLSLSAQTGCRHLPIMSS